MHNIQSGCGFAMMRKQAVQNLRSDTTGGAIAGYQVESVSLRSIDLACDRLTAYLAGGVLSNKRSMFNG